QQTGPTLRSADGSAGPRSTAELGHINALMDNEGRAADAASASKQGMAPLTTADIVQMYRPPPQMRGEVPFYGPNDTSIDKPSRTPGGQEYRWPLNPLNDPAKSAISAGQGLLLGMGMRGAPVGALSSIPGLVSKVTEPAKYAIENIPRVPAAIATTLTGAL